MELNDVRRHKSEYGVGDGLDCVEFGSLSRNSSHTGQGGGLCVEFGETWLRSSHSANGTTCVELTEAWRAAHSRDEGATCVQVQPPVGLVAIRDSKDPDGGMLVVSRRAFRRLTRSLKAG